MSPIILPVSGTGASLLNSPGAATPSRSRHAHSSFGISLPPTEAAAELRALVRRVQGSKRAVVICGAGVSTAANIPDFRSSSGIYNDSGAAQRSALDGVCSPSPAKRARTGSRVKEPTVKDLFHVDALSIDRLRPAQNALLTDLYLKATSARPTAFHRYLAQLEEEGRLLRCYTQNIDGLEGKAGLRVGIPEKEVRGRKRRRAEVEVEVEIGSVASSLGSRAIPDHDTPRPEASLDGRLIPDPLVCNSVGHDGGGLRTSADPVTPTKPRPIGFMPTPPSTHASSIASPLPCTPSPTAFALENPRPDLPRVVPLHGLLARLRCTLCPFTCSFSDRMPMSGLGTGSDSDADVDADTSDLMQCPDCFNIAGIRTALAERQRQSGFLRPDIVLYGEEHRQGHLIGGIVEKDLKGLARAPDHGNDGAEGRRGERRGEKKEGKADLLIVAGTSLSIPGVKRMVKEFAKSIHGSGSSSTPATPSTSAGTRTGRGMSAPSTPSKSRSTASTRSKAKSKGKVVFVNAEPPAKSAEWEGVFDYWVQGDVQTFVTEYLQRDMDDTSDGWLGMPTPPRTPKTPKTPRRRRTAPASTPASEPRARVASAKKRIHIGDSSTPVLSLSSTLNNDGGSTAYDDTCPTPRSDSSAFELDVEVDDGSESQTPTRPRKITLQSRATVPAGEATRIGDADEAESPSGATARSASARKANRAKVLRAADDVFGVGAEDVVSRSDRQRWQVERVLVGREESLTPLSDG